MNGARDTARKVRSSFRGGELKRALTATALGLALGAIIALFSRKDGVNGA